MPVGKLISELDTQRRTANLSTAIRIFVSPTTLQFRIRPNPGVRAGRYGCRVTLLDMLSKHADRGRQTLGVLLTLAMQAQDFTGPKRLCPILRNRQPMMPQVSERLVRRKFAGCYIGEHERSRLDSLVGDRVCHSKAVRPTLFALVGSLPRRSRTPGPAGDCKPLSKTPRS